MKKSLFSMMAALLALYGCGSGDEDASGARKELFLYCGAGLRPAVEQLAGEFEKDRDIEIVKDYAGSETLLNRIRLNRRGDLYMPGDKYYVSQAETDGMIADSASVCYFVPTILIRKAYDKTKIKTIEDVLDGNVRLGVGSDACAIGRNTKKIFEKNGIPPEEVEANVEFHSLTVNELGNHIGAGTLDAVIVWDALAALYTESGRKVEIPPADNVISTVDVGVLSFSKNRSLAREFIKFASSDTGKRIFAAHDYTVEMPE